MAATLIHNRTLSDSITEALREQILAGSLPAGSPLRQEKLAEQFGVSMSALREAFRTLQAEGLITMPPRKGALVKDLSAAEAQELFEARTFLELGALELALPFFTKKHHAQAKEILTQLDATQDAFLWVQLNQQFHEALYAAAQKEIFLSLIRTLHNNVSRYMHLYLRTLNQQHLSQQEHWELLDACKEKNLEKAQQILRIHMRQAQERLVAHLSER